MKTVLLAAAIALGAWALRYWATAAWHWLKLRRQRAHDGQALAVTKHPAPANPPQRAPGSHRGAQLPVPGHRTPIAKRIHVHTCGCVWASTGPGRWERTYDCARLDDELRRLTDDQH